MPWERFIRVLPESQSVPLYEKPPCVSLMACGTFNFNRAAVEMAGAADCEYLEMFFNAAIKQAGFIFRVGPSKHSMRFAPIGNSIGRKCAGKSFAHEFGLIIPNHAVKMTPQIAGGRLIVNLPEGVFK